MSTTTPSAPGPLRSSGTNNNNASSNKRPTTPLRRISASSLRSLSLSHSRSRPASSSELPLQHLSLLFEELSDAFADLAGNFEGLDGVNEGLDAFNEAFGGYLYGLRVNCYTADFDQVSISYPLRLAVCLLSALRWHRHRRVSISSKCRNGHPLPNNSSPPSNPLLSNTPPQTRKMARNRRNHEEEETIRPFIRTIAIIQDSSLGNPCSRKGVRLACAGEGGVGDEGVRWE